MIVRVIILTVTLSLQFQSAQAVDDYGVPSSFSDSSNSELSFDQLIAQYADISASHPSTPSNYFQLLETGASPAQSQLLPFSPLGHEQSGIPHLSSMPKELQPSFEGFEREALLEESLRTPVNLSETVISLTKTIEEGQTKHILNTSLIPDPEIDPLFKDGQVLSLGGELGETAVLECLQEGTRNFMSLYNLQSVEIRTELSSQESMMRFLFIMEELFLRASSKPRPLTYKMILNCRDKLQGKDRHQINAYFEDQKILNLLRIGVNKIKKLILRKSDHINFIKIISFLEKEFNSTRNINLIRKELNTKLPKAFLLPEPVTFVQKGGSVENLAIPFNLSETIISLTPTIVGGRVKYILNTSLKPIPEVDPLFIQGQVLTPGLGLGEMDILECLRKGTSNFISLYNLQNAEEEMTLTAQESVMRFSLIMEEFFIRTSHWKRESVYKGVLDCRDKLRGLDHYQINDYFEHQNVSRILQNRVKRIKKAMHENGGYDHFIENMESIKKGSESGAQPSYVRKKLIAKLSKPAEKEKGRPKLVTPPQISVRPQDFTVPVSLSATAISLTNLKARSRRVYVLNTSVIPDPEIDPLFINGKVLTVGGKLRETAVMECLLTGTKNFMILYNLRKLEAGMRLTPQESMMRFLLLMEEFFMRIVPKGEAAYKVILNYKDKWQGKDRYQINQYFEDHKIPMLLQKGVNRIKELIQEEGGDNHFIENMESIRKKFDKSAPPSTIQKNIEKKLSSPAAGKERRPSSRKRKRIDSSLESFSSGSEAGITDSTAPLAPAIRGARRLCQEFEGTEQLIQRHPLAEAMVYPEAEGYSFYAPEALQREWMAFYQPNTVNPAISEHILQQSLTVPSPTFWEGLNWPSDSVEQPSWQEQESLIFEEFPQPHRATPNLPAAARWAEQIIETPPSVALTAQAEAGPYGHSQPLSSPPHIGQYLLLPEGRGYFSATFG